MPILTAEERVGTLVGGRYRLDSILGTGGTSTVYQALHTFTNRRVAVKLLKPEHASDRGLVARFLKEARVASTIAHPHVVAILDMGTDDESTYLAMELLSGESLAARLGRVGALTGDEAISLLRPLMEAVAVAHDKGIVHRDIKPENVLVGERGDGIERAVLLDFGMAKTTEAAWGHMTQSGVLVGTPYYMSPEQAEGAPDLGPPTDVWSMGVLLYRAFSGDLPFTGSTPTALLLCIARGEHVPLGERAPDLAPALAAWVEGALVADRAKRYADMRAMLRALDEALAGTVRALPQASTSGVRSIEVAAASPAPTLQAAPAARSRTSLYLGALAAAVLVAALAAAFVGSGSSASVEASAPPAVRAPVAAPPARETLAGAATSPAASVEGPTAEVAVAADPPRPPVPEELPEARERTPRAAADREGRVRERPGPRAGAAAPPSGGSAASGLVTEW